MPSKVKRHQCAAIGCARQVSGAMLMCREHWFKVPKALRDRVFRFYYARQNARTPEGKEYAASEHRRAVLEAVKAVGAPQVLAVKSE